MATTDDGGPAFPRPASIDPRSGTLPDGDSLVPEQAGMSLRDYFAATALAAIGVRPSRPADERQEAKCFAAVAADCYALADAMLAARNRPRASPPAGAD